MSKITAVRGMNDIYGDQARRFALFEQKLTGVLRQYAYAPIRLPLLEKTQLFARTIGEVTDIVEKEMYTFEDRNGDSLTLRPEGTAGCVRAMVENGWLHNQTQKVYYLGPMFRYERPQKGRYRQFYQLGVEAFGLQGPDIDAELLAMTARFWKVLGLGDLQLEINSLGNAQERAAHRQALVKYFEQHQQLLDEDAQRRLYSNPLRILDTKNPAMQEMVTAAPQLLDYLQEESRAHFEGLQARLRALGIDFVINPRLVRGLDYYNLSVFEWTTNQLGAQGTVCAGGRYDGLVEQIGGKPTPAVGFAMGVERILALMEVSENAHLTAEADVFVVLVGDQAERLGQVWTESWRNALPHLAFAMNTGGGSFKSQLKKADKSGATFAIIVGDNEAQAGLVNLKPLRQSDEQITVPWDGVIPALAQSLTSA